MKKKPTYKELQTQVSDLQNRLDQLEHQGSTACFPVEIQPANLLFSLVQSLPFNIYAKTVDGVFIFANEYYCRNLNKSPTDIINKTDFDLHPLKLAEKYTQDDKQVMETCRTLEFEEAWKTLDGEEFFVHVIKSPIYDAAVTPADKKVIGTLGVFWDITNEKRTQVALQSSEEKYRSILRNIKEAYVEIDKNSRLVFFNDSLCYMSNLSKEKLNGKLFTNLLEHTDVNRFNQAITKVMTDRKASILEKIPITNPSQEPTYVDISLSPIYGEKNICTGVRGIARDISERLKADRKQKIMEAQLAQSQKLESIGTLAGGIAHDFNNILFIITGYTDLALFSAQEGAEVQDKLIKIKEASARATGLVEQILSFSRYNEKAREHINLSDIVLEVIKLLRSALPASIEITNNITTESLYIIEGDSTEIHQIVMNLGTNAGHAIGKKNGTLNLTLEDYFVDDEFAKNHQGLQPGHYGLLKICDSGKGMSPEVKERVFEPFFTTKKTGDGTGLGLSVVHGIVTAMSGFITVNSTPGSGTTFSIFLPLSKQCITPQKQKNQGLIKGDGEHILVVDDEKEIIQMLSAMLNELGYTCTTAQNGQEALEIFTTAPDQFDLILTDQTMPIMTGISLSEKILNSYPDKKIILCTGFGHSITKEEVLSKGVAEYLTKPILQQELSSILNKVLNNHLSTN